MIEHRSDQLRYFTFHSLPEGRIVHAIFTRLGGVSPWPWASLNVSTSTGDSVENTRANRRRAFDALGLPFDSMADVWQVHSARTVRVDGPRGARPPIQADGLVTDRRGVALFQRFADCVPILLYDPARHALGLAHAGWRGTATGAAVSAVEAMAETYGSRPSDLVAAMGPSIGPDHYEVGPEVARAIQHAFPGADDVLLPHDGRIRLDLWAANARALRQAGVEQIEIAGLCTACHHDLFFSHRAESGQTGRFGAVAALRD